jgi:hypothetical protein
MAVEVRLQFEDETAVWRSGAGESGLGEPAEAVDLSGDQGREAEEVDSRAHFQQEKQTRSEASESQ